MATQRTTFLHAIHCLSHPVSIMAMVILLLNDHLFRIYLAGWWTGKLGDFAWLFFFPFVVAILLAWLIPQKVKAHSLWVSALSIGLTGILFALAKTIPPFHQSLIWIASALFGFPVGWRMDPTDLTALVSLAGSAWLWNAQKPVKASGWPKWRWLLLPAAGLLTLANGMQPETGIICLESWDKKIIAQSSRAIYLSDSGGLEWEESSFQANLPSTCDYSFLYAQNQDQPEIETWTDSYDASVIYRTTRGESIERSTDSGRTYTLEFSLRPTSEAMRSFYARRASGDSMVSDGPFDVLFDPKSKNLIFAMGHSGVLVRQPDATYQWVDVGLYQYQVPGISQLMMILFPGEVLLALILGAVGVMVVELKQQSTWFRWFLTGAAGVAWGFVMIVAPPALMGFGYGEIAVMILLGLSGLTLLPMMLERLISVGTSDRKRFISLVLIFTGSSLAFFLPFVFWELNLLPSYRLAQWIGVVFGVGWILKYFFQNRSSQGKRSPDLHIKSGWLLFLSVSLGILAVYFFSGLVPHFQWLGVLFLFLSLVAVVIPFFYSRNRK